jgi:EAL domain-containing protein (putative c-di-GMP-specific phosphodiesterase class I)
LRQPVGAPVRQRLPKRIAACWTHRVQPDQINLEITESLLVRGTDKVIAIMNQLVAWAWRWRWTTSAPAIPAWPT